MKSLAVAKSLTVIKSPVVTLRLAVIDLLLVAPMDTLEPIFLELRLVKMLVISPYNALRIRWCLTLGMHEKAC
jgi:hypothetical protein